MSKVLEQMKQPWEKVEVAGLVCLMALVLLLTVLHTLFISRGSTSYFYAGLRDVAITLISTGMCIHDLTWRKKDKGHAMSYLIRASLFVIVGVIHLLRLFWGGLLC